MKLFYTTRRHIEVSYANHVHTTACGLQMMLAPNRKETALFDCPVCFGEKNLENQ